jgi:hypothetical protein
MDGLALVDAIALIRKLLETSVSADAAAKAKISGMTDDEVVAYAREVCSQTDKQAGEFINKLES